MSPSTDPVIVEVCPRAREHTSSNEAATSSNKQQQGEHIMKRFVIEREIPGASELTEQQLAEIAVTSNAAAASLGVPYRWVNSYVAGDKIYCVHEADDEATIREHARRGEFPADVVSVVANEFGPQTADLVAG
jgi:Nickel responsive protein SCO4226-like